MLLNYILLITASLPYVEAPAKSAHLEPTRLSHAGFAEPPVALEDMAPGPWYAKFSYGFVTTESSSGPGEEVDFDEGYGLHLAFGKSVWRSDTGQTDVSLEIEGLWRDQDVDSSGITQAVRDVNIGALMVNGIADWHVSPRFDASLGVGVGLAWVNADTRSDDIGDFSSDNGPNFAWNVQAGLGYLPSASTRWGISYRLLNVDDTQIEDDISDAKFDLETMQHSIEIGVRIML